MGLTIPQTMKAIQLMGYKKPYQLNDIPVPEVGDNELLLKSGAAGFCHTDYQVWEGVYGSPTPCVPSHEPVGTIVAMGTKAEAGGKWKLGQRVGYLLFKHPCKKCIGCETFDDVRFCEVKQLAGLMNDGGMAEYSLADADNAVLLPDDIPWEQAAPLMCAGTTTWAGIETLGLPTGAPVGVVGIGGLGSLAIQFAKAFGYRVAAIDNREEGRSLAADVPNPAVFILDPNQEGSIEKVKTWAGNMGLAGVVICTDKHEATTWALQSVRPRGVVVEIGLPTKPLPVEAFNLVFNELVFKGSLVANTKQAEDMMTAVAKFKIKTEVHPVSLEEAVRLPEMYMDPHLKGRLVVKMAA